MRLDQGVTRKYSFFSRIDRTGLKATSLQRTPVRNGFKAGCDGKPDCLVSPLCPLGFAAGAAGQSAPTGRRQIARIGKLAFHTTILLAFSDEPRLARGMG
jgi:hypothetical protein